MQNTHENATNKMHCNHDETANHTKQKNDSKDTYEKKTNTHEEANESANQYT